MRRAHATSMLKQSYRPKFLDYYGEAGSAPGALDTPDRDPTQTTTNIMRVAGQTPSPATGCLVFELEAKGQNEGDHTFEKRLAVFNQAKVGRLVSKIHGDGTVFPWWFGLASHRSPPGQVV